jgi:hypothetical protein
MPLQREQQSQQDEHNHRSGYEHTFDRRANAGGGRPEDGLARAAHVGDDITHWASVARSMAPTVGGRLHLDQDPPHRAAAGALDAGEQRHLPCTAAASGHDAGS